MKLWHYKEIRREFLKQTYQVILFYRIKHKLVA
jgi:hypothetical protein